MRYGWLAVVSLGTLGCYNGLLLTPVQVDRPVEEVVVSEPERCCCRNKVALIDVEGMILNAKTSSLLGGPGENMVALFRERLDEAAADRRVKAVVLRLNTPGGAVTATDGAVPSRVVNVKSPDEATLPARSRDNTR